MSKLKLNLGLLKVLNTQSASTIILNSVISGCFSGFAIYTIKGGLMQTNKGQNIYFKLIFTPKTEKNVNSLKFSLNKIGLTLTKWQP